MSDEEKLMDELEDLTGYYVNVGIGSYKNKDIAVIELWFNDMFAWAYSHAMTFMIPGVVTLEELNSKFKEWYEKEGKNILKRFDDVEYPEINKKGQYKDNEVERYFAENCIIGADLEVSINKFCGIEENTALLVEEGTE